MKKIKVGILFGGKSAEHEVSLQSAKNVVDALNKEKYEPVLIGIDKEGVWSLNSQADFLLNDDNPKLITLNTSGEHVTLVPQNAGQLLNTENGIAVSNVDVIFPILHGPYGEDGTVQGLFKLAGVPFVGSGVLGSAVGMDKDIMKRLLRDAGIKIGKYITLKDNQEVPVYEDIFDNLGVPFYIKPANMGSSVGVSRVSKKDEYQGAIQEAFKYDRKIILEETISGRELECAVLGNDDPQASVVGEVVNNTEFYSYDAKYIDTHGAEIVIPADISSEIQQEIQETSIRVFQVLECVGLGRVDCFLTESGEIVVNEINTMPGFTSISMYPKLWEQSGTPYTDLIGELIELAIEQYDKEKRLVTNKD